MHADVGTILHITTLSEWDAACAAGSYCPASLAREGFLHGSTATQTVATANKYFRGRTDLVILCIDESRVATEVRYEPPITVAGTLAATVAGAPDPRAHERFPHIYGPLPLDAVVRVVPFPCEPDGSFALPAGAAG